MSPLSLRSSSANIRLSESHPWTIHMVVINEVSYKYKWDLWLVIDRFNVTDSQSDCFGFKSQLDYSQLWVVTGWTSNRWSNCHHIQQSYHEELVRSFFDSQSKFPGSRQYRWRPNCILRGLSWTWGDLHYLNRCPAYRCLTPITLKNQMSRIKVLLYLSTGTACPYWTTLLIPQNGFVQL